MGKGGCAYNVYSLMTSQFDYDAGGAPPGCRDPEGQAELAITLELGVLGAAALVGAGYGLVLARDPR